MDWIDTQAQMPWLGSPPFWLSHADGSRLRESLTRLGFVVFEAGASAAATDAEFRQSMSDAMGLADYAWENWNTFVDAFGDLVRSTTLPIALIWLNPLATFLPDVHNGLRLYSTLASILGEWNRVGPECHQVELFLQGDKAVPSDQCSS
jgi:hypothetical protein